MSKLIDGPETYQKQYTAMPPLLIGNYNVDVREKYRFWLSLIHVHTVISTLRIEITTKARNNMPELELNGCEGLRSKSLYSTCAVYS